ncbi:MAG: zinc ribbon domain-containing protein [Acidobacteria bacterium]|jgi:putative FmdB family regulatory protein|nr:zinc ribbon domain-containing protein [Acidobacteriota bacterium]
MPLYEYRCSKCNNRFEVLQKINEEPLTECLYCQGQVEKLVSLSSFQLKGSGWYVNDYKSQPGNTDYLKKDVKDVQDSKGGTHDASTNK